MDNPYIPGQDFPDFDSSDFLLNHIRSILEFYDDRCSDKKGGGFFQFFKVSISADFWAHWSNDIFWDICKINGWKDNVYFRTMEMFMTRKQDT